MRKRGVFNPDHPWVFFFLALSQARGFAAHTTPIARSDWLRVAACALDPDYWRSTACVSRAYGWYLAAAAAAVSGAAAASASGKVVLVGHSAGGWLGRALIGREPAVRASVAGLVSLGTPHAPPSGARCPTGGALASICDAFPGAFFAGEGVAYVTVAGLAVRGDARAVRGSAARAAAAAYATVSGAPSRGAGGHGVLGDGVVPAAAAGLAGAVNLALPGVFHSQARPGGRGRGGRAAAERLRRTGGGAQEVAPLPSRLPWYGSEGVVDAWLGAVVEQSNR